MKEIRGKSKEVDGNCKNRRGKLREIGNLTKIRKKWEENYNENEEKTKKILGNYENLQKISEIYRNRKEAREIVREINRIEEEGEKSVENWEKSRFIQNFVK